MPDYFPEGNTPTRIDTRWRLLQKIAGGVSSGGGGGGGAARQTFAGASPPADPTVSGTGTQGYLWYPTAGGQIKEWDGSAWV